MFEVPMEDANKVRTAISSRQQSYGDVYRTRKLQNGNLGVWRTA